MARPKAFDRTEALDQAMHLFWRQGYEATSLPELLTTMGIGRQSLYDTFGGKHRLYMASLERYRDMIWATLAELQKPTASVKDIRTWFDTMVEFYADGPDSRACFLINCTMELAPHNDEVESFVKEHYQHMEDAMTHGVERCVERGEIKTERPRALARALLSASFGMSVYSKSGHPRATLEDIANVSTTAFVL